MCDYPATYYSIELSAGLRCTDGMNIVSSGIRSSPIYWRCSSPFYPDDIYARTFKALALRKLGNEDEANSEINKIINYKIEGSDDCYDKGCAYALLGKDAEAIDLLRQVIQNSKVYKYRARSDEDWDSLKYNFDYLKLTLLDGLNGSDISYIMLKYKTSVCIIISIVILLVLALIFVITYHIIKNKKKEITQEVIGE